MKKLLNPSPVKYLLAIIWTICERTYDYTTIILRYYGYSLILSPIGTTLGLGFCLWLAHNYHWYLHLLYWTFLIGLSLHIVWPWMRSWNHNAIEIMKDISEEWA